MDSGGPRDQFFEACKVGDLERIRTLLDEGDVNVDTREKDFPKAMGIHIASFNGKLDVVKFLVEKGCSVTATDQWNPMMYACDGNHLEIVKYYVETHNYDLDFSTEEGETALHRCCENDFCEITKYLVQKGADFTLINGSSKTAPELLKEESELIKFFDEQNRLKDELKNMSVHDFFELKNSPAKIITEMKLKEEIHSKTLELNKNLFTEEKSKLEMLISEHEKSIQLKIKKHEKEKHEIKLNYEEKIKQMELTQQKKLEKLTLEFKKKQKLEKKKEEVKWTKILESKKKKIKELMGEEIEEEMSTKNIVVSFIFLVQLLLLIYLFISAVFTKWFNPLNENSLNDDDDFDDFL